MRLWLLVLAALLLPRTDVLAQSGTHAPLALLLPASSRALALGDAYVAVRDVDVLFYNPAQLFGARTGVAASAQRYNWAGTLVSVSGAAQAGPAISTGLGVQVVDYDAPLTGAYPVAVTDLRLASPIVASSAALALGSAIVFRGIRFGAAIKYVEDRLGNERDGTFAGDVGAARDVGLFTFGLAVQDIGSGLEVRGVKGELPSRITVGVAGGGYPLGAFIDLGVTTALTLRRDSRVTPAVGGELLYTPIEGIIAAVRAGVRRPEKDAGSPVTAGLGFSYDRVGLDYAFEGFSGRGSAHRFGMRIR